MRKVFIISAIVFGIIGIIFSVLPFGTIAFLPLVLAIISALIAFLKSTEKQKLVPRIILIFCFTNVLFVAGNVLLIKDKVATDPQFELKKEESKKEDVKDLEGL
jgi:mannitol-specific phosphotransferase system IIBC component